MLIILAIRLNAHWFFMVRPIPPSCVSSISSFFAKLRLGFHSAIAWPWRSQKRLDGFCNETKILISVISLILKWSFSEETLPTDDMKSIIKRYYERRFTQSHFESFRLVFLILTNHGAFSKRRINPKTLWIAVLKISQALS